MLIAEQGTIGESAYRCIRADIVFGRLAPGEKLKLDRLKEAYGASISTLREVLSRLAAEGLVTAEGQRGFEVAPISGENLREIAALRKLLEGHALELSFEAGDMEWEGRIVSAHHKLAAMEERMLKGERSFADLWKSYDWEFHQALVSACGSRVLMEAHAAAYDKYLRYQMVGMIFRGEIAAREHKKLLTAALKRDVPAAKAVLQVHIDGCVDFTLKSGLFG